MAHHGAYKAEGVILKRKNYGEADRIVTVFTRQYGKVRIIAKGVRKVKSRRAPHLEVFSRVHLVLAGRPTLENLSEVSPIDVYGPIRSDLTRISIAYYICDLVDSLLPEKQEHPDIFVLLVEALGTLSVMDITRVYGMSRKFTLDLLWTLGFLPQSKSLQGRELQAFIETITERRMKSTVFAKLLKDQAGA